MIVPAYPGHEVLCINFYGLEIWHGIFLGSILVQGFFWILFEAQGIFRGGRGLEPAYPLKEV